MIFMLTLDRIYEAKNVLSGIIRHTDTVRAANISHDCDLYLKTENLQVTGSFKVRGAIYRMSKLTDKEKSLGVCACSAGNHAQGVALAAKKMGIKARIFMPSMAAIYKIEATRALGAEVTLVDGVFDDAYKASIDYAKESGAVFISPFDDEGIIAGQGTIGLEILEQLPDVDAVVTAVGGGGLISGIAFVIKQLKPSVKVYGVQAQGASGMLMSLTAGHIEGPKTMSTFADGIAVRLPGKLTFDACKKYVDEVVTVTDDEISASILALMEQQKVVSEGAGAAPVAAIMFNKIPNLKGKKVVAVISGGNIDVNILSRVISRGLLKAGRLSDITIKLIDKPGQLKEVSTIIAEYGANVIKVRHNLGVENMAINSCLLHVSMETRNREHTEEIKTALIKAGYELCKEEH